MYVESYLNRLKVNAIIFDDDILDELEYPATKEYIYSLEFLECLLFRVNISKMVEELDCHVIDNIREVLNYIRFNNVNKEYIPLINKILVLLNGMQSRGSSTFYKAQYLKRNGIFTSSNFEKKDFELYTDAHNKEYLQRLRDFICLDHDLLDTLLHFSDSEYIKEISKYNAEEFLSTINIVSYECSVMFENELFRKRVNYILKHLNILEGKRNVKDMYNAYKVYRKVKKVI